MKRVWKCDFCSDTTNIKEQMASHETGCSFNPINKRCYSCKHHDYVDSITTECEIGVDITTMLDIQEDELSCEKWEEI